MIIPLNLNIYHTNTHIDESQVLKTNSIFTSNITLISDGYNNIYWNEGYNEVPDMALDPSGNIHVVWKDNTVGIWGGGLDEEIMHAFYDESNGWSNATVISDGYSGVYWNNGSSDNPEIAIDNLGKVHAVWQDNTDGIWGTSIQIMYASYNQSMGWSNATVISDGYSGVYWNNDSNTYPSIAIDSFDNFHIVWQGQKDGSWGTDIEIMYVSYNQSIGWSNVTVISDDVTLWNNGNSLYPKINIDPNNNLHVVWQDHTVGLWGSDTEIMYASYNQSIGWSNVTVISDDVTFWNNGSSDLPEIAIDSNDIIHVIWQDSTIGTWGSDMEIMYAFYSQSIGWSNATVISDDINLWNDGLSYRSSIYVDNQNNLHVVWQDSTEGPWGSDIEIMYKSFFNNVGWSNITIVSDGYENSYWNTDDSTNPSIIVDNSGIIHIVWDEFTSGPWTDDMFDTEIMHVSIIFQTQTSINSIYYFNILISIFFFGIIALFLFIEDKKKKRSIESTSLKKKSLIHAIKISLALTVSILQISQIEYNSKTFTPITPQNILIHIFPIILLVISLLILILLIISVISTLEEYKIHLRLKSNEIIIGHRMKFEQIFENENRKKIITKVLENPSIHFNELLRECNITRGQLQWHLRILLEFGIIKKEKIGQFMTFKPIFDNLDLSRIIKKLTKSKMCMKICDIITNSPGIIQSDIAKKLSLDPSTVNYHIKKLKKADLIICDNQGRNSHIYLKKDIIDN